MPRYIEELNENTTPAIGDWLWIVDVDAGATDQDRKLSVGKLALLATANTFTAAQSIIGTDYPRTRNVDTALILSEGTTAGDPAGIIWEDSGGAVYLRGVDGLFEIYSISGAGDISGGNLRVRISLAGNILIGTSTDVTSARLQVGGTTGALLVSRLNTDQRNALTPINGMILYNSSTNKFQGYEAGAWVNLI